MLHVIFKKIFLKKMRFYKAFGRTFMIIREIGKKKFFFETAKKNRKGPPLQFWVKNHRWEIKKFPQKSKCTLKS